MSSKTESLSPTRMLREVHGKKAKIFSSRHHARYFEDDKAFHVVSRVVCGLGLLVPRADINEMIAGVLGHVQKKNPQVELFAYAFLSNHFHLALRGPGIPEFVGQLKQQISLRLKYCIDEPFETLWSGRYAATALINGEDQERCFEYILSQGVKEGLVDTPEDWPGVHCAKHVFFDQQCRGTWLNATSYGEAKRFEERKPPDRRKKVSKSDHLEEVSVEIFRLPVYADLDESAYRHSMTELRERIIMRGKEARAGKPALGVSEVLRMPRTTRFKTPKPPWFTDRRRMIVWSDPNREETRAYLERYHQSQLDFAVASRRYRAGERTVRFPPGMYLPSVPPMRPRVELAA
ncbi:MAG: hypothetical protein AAFU77_04885 [Myxococcota bacterium]